MRIVNAMFGKGLGGIEQAFVDYCQALSEKGHDVHVFIHPEASCSTMTNQLQLPVWEISNKGQWDFIAAWKLHRKLKKIKPDLVIAHGSRSISLLRMAGAKTMLVGVCHNYWFKHIIKCHAIISITDNIREKLIQQGYPSKQIFSVPNMIRENKKKSTIIQKKPANKKIVIGAMGRFSNVKGFDVFIRALSIIQQHSIEFKAVLGGAGTDESNLRQLASELKLDNSLTFYGWVENKEDFFKQCDIFCVPSRRESFGIVLLEAFLHNIPVVVTDCEGPCEIVSDGYDALLAPKEDPQKLAIAIERLLTNKELATQLANAAYKTVVEKYTMPVVAETLSNVVLDIASQLK
ncbi:hypothetical protein MNBD_GAMMA12-1722 [hydrothermal vent metagenome]|uniref:Glycosyltransferase n=1 Tax=hydrothermal vent metagenome TaxID=652676 RepID=A0A3B0YAJ6_9ZZZZ